MQSLPADPCHSRYTPTSAKGGGGMLQPPEPPPGYASGATSCMNYRAGEHLWKNHRFTYLQAQSGGNQTLGG